MRNNLEQAGSSTGRAVPLPPVVAKANHTPATLPPLLAGARARGMADAFDLIGQAAILFDGAGMVLHANAAARARLGCDLAITRRHLVGSTAEVSRALQALISAAGGRSAAGNLEIAGAHGSFTVEALTVPGAAGESGQMLKTIVLIR